MNPGNFTLELFRGRASTWHARLWKDRARTQPVDLTGCVPVAGITLADGSKLLLAAEVFEGELEGVPVTPQMGRIQITITAEQSALMTGTYYNWTLGVRDSGGDWNPCLKGPVKVATDDSLEPV